MSINKLPLFVVVAALSTACLNKDDEDTGTEEPASEPAEEEDPHAG